MIRHSSKYQPATAVELLAAQRHLRLWPPPDPDKSQQHGHAHDVGGTCSSQVYLLKDETATCYACGRFWIRHPPALVEVIAEWRVEHQLRQDLMQIEASLVTLTNARRDALDDFNAAKAKKHHLKKLLERFDMASTAEKKAG